MYVYKRQVTMQRGIATLLAIALVLWAVGSHMFTTAEAANLIGVKNTLSSSAPAVVSDHEIEFTTPTGVASTETIVVTFPGGFDLSAITISDVELEINTATGTLVAAAPGVDEWLYSLSGQVITFTSGGASAIAGANADIVVRVGVNAGGTNQVVNPGTGFYQFVITAGSQDSGKTMVAIVSTVEVTADIDTTLTFYVNGTTSGITVNGSPTTTADTTTSTEIPFGTLTADVSKVLAQELLVATNARNGYVVTVQQSQNLLSSTGAIIDSFYDGTYEDTPSPWQKPSNDVNSNLTWGHWGLTSTDDDLLGAGIDFGADEWIGISTSPRAIMAHDDPADGSTLGIGRAVIGYQIEVTPLQEAGDDYSTTLMYIATPTF